ncbi:hypothetical protein EYZ11_006567 [Aspergillus tanneri]|uniref:Uncharacterized protein n=1 Tax=Aspergillus tanneri TaxID=1220188 RepID=A0A4S3JF45_9EURO|nr:uncharacterized protein ATNIH1004_007281 [Aspergillus tanneri]KAA8645860.1 hypothetical protein ATNIH1004_007281 [Aspergillus tanneri]THC93956.1 hypothetical protein EYZ11_006567 [Aspergillus tanneri]
MPSLTPQGRRLFSRHPRPQSLDLPPPPPSSSSTLSIEDLDLRPRSFQGQPPPPEGYFSPDSVVAFSPPLGEDYFPRHTYTESASPDSVLSLQPSLYRSSTAPHPHTHPPPSNSPSSTITTTTSPTTASTSTNNANNNININTPRGRRDERSYAQDLHLRSRSPKAFAPRPHERHIPSTNPHDPAVHLGTFRSNPRTSRIGDQERPWKLTIPGAEDDDAGETLLWLARGRSQPELRSQSRSQSELQLQPRTYRDHDLGSRPPTYEEDQALYPRRSVRPVEKSGLNPGEGSMAGSGGHPSRGLARALNRNDMPVELPVRGEDESSEEIVMSSTAYPGQEWRPLGLEHSMNTDHEYDHY